MPSMAKAAASVPTWDAPSTAISRPPHWPAPCGTTPPPCGPLWPGRASRAPVSTNRPPPISSLSSTPPTSSTNRETPDVVSDSSTTASCDRCHGLTNSPNSAAPPIASWHALAAPIELTQAMWNHSGGMYAEMQQKKMSWPQLTGQDLSDLLVYLRNLPVTPTKQSIFITTAGSQGEALFASKGCKACHDPSTLLFRTALDNRTLTDVAAALWDHAPRMKTPPAHFETNEMRELLELSLGQSSSSASMAAPTAAKRSLRPNTAPPAMTTPRAAPLTSRNVPKP